jgi:hypothetical protein
VGNGLTTDTPEIDAIACTSNDISSGDFSRFDDSNPHTIAINYSWLNKVLIVVLDGNADAPLLSTELDIETLVTASNGLVWSGLTASTGKLAHHRLTLH